MSTTVLGLPAAPPRPVAELEAALLAALRPAGSVLVAFSGGADSALVLAAAARALAPGAVAGATAVSDAVPDAEVSEARRFAEALGVAWHEPRTDELAREGYRRNAGDRCFFCKSELMAVLVPLAERLGLAHVATGTNADDLRAGFRPGIRAAAQARALTPLADAGFTKAEVRALSAAWGLPTWDKPAAACLSSRIAYGTEITPERLRRVGIAEQRVRAHLADAVRDVRVRDLGDGTARLELDAACLDRLDARARETVTAEVRAAGFDAVAVRAFRSGAMNDLLAEPERYR
ncbi:ATP-dependent sacrificial sulfur transferase LarE [Aquipuribacter nitratireducens]|uniref:ATP-dependent sacrificial sulfur transferase LarE n=1 Tax=Aquipuribacter nitratireducens TaxID=650104 RepID=A0ABW0GNB2_9MICO